MDVPLIDLGAAGTAERIDRACREIGFFVVVGHGIDPRLFERLDAAAREFFALPDVVKQRIAMVHGGRAWRGWFPLGGEVTAGVPDGKEGLYFGEELGDDDRRVAAGLPLHGPNLFPPEVPELRDAVLAWFAALTGLGHRLMAEIALGLGLSRTWFSDHLTADPTLLFRIFRYPDTIDHAWGVAEHTDYGLLTMLAQDDCGGLQVRNRSGAWLDVAPVPNSFVCNIGDMLERMTGGRYRSTPHRVRNTSGRDRLSYPFFFDPSWTARIDPLPLDAAPGPEPERTECTPEPVPRSRADAEGPQGAGGGVTDRREEVLDGREGLPERTECTPEPVPRSRADAEGPQGAGGGVTDRREEVLDGREGLPERTECTPEPVPRSRADAEGPQGAGGGVRDNERWDGRSVFEFDGTYGEYLSAKVARVFPHLVGTL